jgi:cytoskeletal protein CcmA (bactofilin family)
MSQEKNQKRESRLSNLTSALRRHEEERLEISAYRVGGVRAEKAVIVTAGGTLIGDLLAPEIVVEGLIYGYVACQRLIVAPGGQIWGDVYVSTLELAPEGKINGWVSTLDAGTVDLLRAKELGTGDLPGRDDWHLPAELLEQVQNAGADVEDDQRESQRRSGIWRQLRSRSK